MGRMDPKDAAYDLPCPSCGSLIEFFFDDTCRKCLKCNARVEKDYAHLLKDYGCAAWCPEAEKCLGSDIYKRFTEAKQRHEKENKLEEIVKPKQ